MNRRTIILKVIICDNLFREGSVILWREFKKKKDAGLIIKSRGKMNGVMRKVIIKDYLLPYRMKFFGWDYLLQNDTDVQITKALQTMLFLMKNSF